MTTRNINKNIKDLRIRSGLTQDELAQQLFVTRQTVSNNETGKSRPDIDMLMRIAEVLDTDINTILYGIQPKDRKPLIRLAVGGGLTLAMGILWLISRDGHQIKSFNFEIGIMTWLYNISQPVFFGLLGWTLTQGIAVLAKAKQPQFPAGKWICLGIACIVILWSTLLAGMISGLFSIPQALYRPCYIAFIYSVKYPWLLLFPGFGIWLCGFPQKRK